MGIVNMWINKNTEYLESDCLLIDKALKLVETHYQTIINGELFYITLLETGDVLCVDVPHITDDFHFIGVQVVVRVKCYKSDGLEFNKDKVFDMFRHIKNGKKTLRLRIAKLINKY